MKSFTIIAAISVCCSLFLACKKQASSETDEKEASKQEETTIKTVAPTVVEVNRYEFVERELVGDLAEADLQTGKIHRVWTLI